MSTDTLLEHVDDVDSIENAPKQNIVPSNGKLYTLNE